MDSNFLFLAVIGAFDASCGYRSNPKTFWEVRGSNNDHQQAIEVMTRCIKNCHNLLRITC